MTAVVDTSFLMGLLNVADPHHAEALREARAQDALLVPPVVLAETLNLVQYRASRQKGVTPHDVALAALEALGAQPTVVLDAPPHDHEATARIWRAHPKLDYSDAAAVAAARAKGVGLCTFDKDQLAAHRSGKP